MMRVTPASLHHGAPLQAAQAVCLRVGTSACDRPAQPAPGLAAYLSGSDADPWIPAAAFTEAAGALAAGGARLRAESHPGRASRRPTM